jgi:hypothetical protein
MGVVYAAEDRQRGRVIALKTLQINSAETAYALKQEFRTLTDLSHPNLVRLHELFVEPERVFFTMDVVEGGPFDRCASTQIRHALTQLVAGVQALHGAGKLHRDLKPGNVLVEPDGRLVVLDFGLVRDRRRSQDPSESGALVGTPRYMAPELLSWGGATEQSDWYAVGVMLYEALTGTLPDEGGLARLVRQGPPPPPSEVSAGVSTEYDQICTSLLQPDLEKRGNGDDILGALGVDSVRAPQSVIPASKTHLVGRASQLQTLADAYRRNRERREPGAIMVSGLSGMGKTALVREFLRQQAGDATVLWGQCREQEAVSHKAFDELVDAVAHYLLRRSPEQAFEIVSPDEAQHLLRLFPGLGRIPALAPLVGDDEDADPRALRKAAYDALRRVLVRMSKKRPLILAIDDLQWGDLDSARLLYDLFSGSERPACFLVLSYRADEADGSVCVQRLLTGARCLADVIDVQSLSVSELDRDDAATLACSLLHVEPSNDDQEALARVSALCREAEGSPLLLHELAEQYATAERADDPGQHEVRVVGLLDVVRTRLSRVDQLGRRLFQLVCVDGTPVREALLRAALGNVSIDQAVVQLEAQRLIRARASRSADAVEVVHDGIRTAALKEMTPAELRRAHEDLARAYAGATEPDVDALARHYAGAKLHGEASYWARKAGARASASFAFDRAAQFYRMALELGEPDTPTANHLRVLLANALAEAGRGVEAAPLFMEAAKHATPADALEYRRRAADQWLFTGRLERGLEVLTAVFDEVGMTLPRGKAGAVVSLLGNRMRTGLRGLDFVERKTEEIDPEDLLRLDACRAAWMLSFVSTLQGAALQSRFLRYALEAGEPSRVAMGLAIEALQRSVEGDNAARWALQKRSRALAERLNTPHALGFQALADGDCAYLAGEWRTCSDDAEVADDILTRRCQGSTWELNTLRFFWAMSLYYQGRFRELRRRSSAWLVDAEDRGDLCAQAGYHLNGARSVCLADDNPAQAHADLKRGLDEWSLPELSVHRFLAECARVQVQLYEGDVEAATATIDRLWPEFRSSSMRRVQLARVLAHYHTAFVALARAAKAEGNVKARKQALRQAASHQAKLEGESTPWGNALASYVAAQRALFQDSRDQAEARFERAAKALDERGMLASAAAVRYRQGRMRGDAAGNALIEQARAFMRAQGVRVPDRFLEMLAPGL